MRLPLVAALACTAFIGTLHAQPKPAYEIYAIRYATLKDFAVSGCRLARVGAKIALPQSEESRSL